MKQLSAIEKDQYGYHFSADWSGTAQIENELVVAREKCSIRSVDVNWTIGQTDTYFTAVVNGSNEPPVRKLHSFLLTNGWKLADTT